MENYTQPMVLIPILIFIALALGYYFFAKARKPRRKLEETGEAAETTGTGEEAEKEVIYEPITARVLDNKLGRIYNEEIPASVVKEIVEAHKTLGRQWDRYGKKLYGLIKDAEGNYKPMITPSAISNSPVELHNDMQQPEVEILFDMSADKGFLQKYGQILWWVAVMAFIMFMWSQS